MILIRAAMSLRTVPFLCAALLAAGCAQAPRDTVSRTGLEPERIAFAVEQSQELRAKGQRVWCVPFARNLSGIDIRGNAKTWWAQAQGRFEQQAEPQVGAVMAFRSTRSMPQGHVAVVSRVLGPRQILIDHANWHRNQVSLGMAVIDVSGKNDWSAVRVESQPDSFGSVYPVAGFILPKPGNG